MKYLLFLIPLFVIVSCKTTKLPNESTTDCEAYYTKLSEELKRQQKWGNKHFLCKTSIDTKTTLCTYDEIKWNKNVFRPMARNLEFEDSIRVSYYYIQADSVDLYLNTFDYSLGVWVFVKNQENE